VSDAHRAALEQLMQQLASSGDEPPSVSELRATTGDATEALLRVLERDGRIIQVEPGRYYPAPTLASLVDRLRAGMQRGREYSPSELRELLGFSRKFLIPLLEYCDRQGHTQRSEAGRVWRGA
jgi:selenocysteine-specific elongation factor